MTTQTANNLPFICTASGSVNHGQYYLQQKDYCQGDNYFDDSDGRGCFINAASAK